MNHISIYDLEFDKWYSILDKDHVGAELIADENMRRRRRHEPEIKTLKEANEFLNYKDNYDNDGY